MKKNKPNPRKWMVIVMGAVVFLLFFSVVPKLLTIYDLNQQKQELAARKAQLETRNQQLKQKYREAGEPETVERLAREKLGMVKDGETLMVQVAPAGDY